MSTMPDNEIELPGHEMMRIGKDGARKRVALSQKQILIIASFETLCADLINEADFYSKENPRLIAMAKTHIEKAGMCFVKAITTRVINDGDY